MGVLRRARALPVPEAGVPASRPGRPALGLRATPSPRHRVWLNIHIAPACTRGRAAADDRRRAVRGDHRVRPSRHRRAGHQYMLLSRLLVVCCGRRWPKRSSPSRPRVVATISPRPTPAVASALFTRIPVGRRMRRALLVHPWSHIGRCVRGRAVARVPPRPTWPRRRQLAIGVPDRAGPSGTSDAAATMLPPGSSALQVRAIPGPAAPQIAEAPRYPG